MTFDLQEELVISSYKTVDGRGADILFNGSWCLVAESVSHVIIHGIHVTGCQRPPGYGTPAYRASPKRSSFDGDGIQVVQSQHVWIDHCRISYCADGVLDVTKSSNYTSITNNYFEHNQKVMLLGHSHTWVIDKLMLATVACNHFGEGAEQRMPRCRFGNFHVVNNFYLAWGMYMPLEAVLLPLFTVRETTSLLVIMRPKRLRSGWTILQETGVLSTTSF